MAHSQERLCKNLLLVACVMWPAIYGGYDIKYVIKFITQAS